MCVCVLHMQGDPLWSARLLHTDPQAIRDAHYRCVHAKNVGKYKSVST